MMRVALLATLLGLTACATDPEQEPECVVDPSSDKLPCLPPGSTVYLGDKPVQVIEWAPDHIKVRIPPARANPPVTPPASST